MMIYFSETQLSATLVVLLWGVVAVYSCLHPAREVLRTAGMMGALYVVVVSVTIPALAFCSAPFQMGAKDFCAADEIQRIQFVGLGRVMQSLAAGTSSLLVVLGLFFVAWRRAQLKRVFVPSKHLQRLHWAHLVLSPAVLLLPFVCLPRPRAVMMLLFTGLDGSCTAQLPHLPWRFTAPALAIPTLAWLGVVLLSRKSVGHSALGTLALWAMAQAGLCLTASSWIIWLMGRPMHEVLFDPAHLILSVAPFMILVTTCFVVLAGMTYSLFELRKLGSMDRRRADELDG